MTRPERVTLFTSTLLATGTGAAYAWLRYGLENDDPFTAYNHPLQPRALEAHILLAPVLVFAVGWIFATHVVPRLGSHPARRASGVALLALFGAMVVSGYALQISSEPAWRTALAWIHGLAGAAWTLLFLAHAWTGRARGGGVPSADAELTP